MNGHSVVFGQLVPKLDYLGFKKWASAAQGLTTDYNMLLYFLRKLFAVKNDVETFFFSRSSFQCTCKDVQYLGKIWFTNSFVGKVRAMEREIPWRELRT